MQSRATGAHCLLFTGWYARPSLPDGSSEEQLLPQSPPFGDPYVSPPFGGPYRPYPEPEYQAGELSHFEGTAEHGFYERESEEQGSPPRRFAPGPPPPPYLPGSPEIGFTSYPRPPYWGFSPYYYDYRLLRGQYPPGTYTHASASFEHGRDGWKDVHYLRENVPRPAEPVQQTGTSLTFAASQPGKVPMVYTGQ